jgi:hypothetical protein
MTIDEVLKINANFSSLTQKVRVALNDISYFKTNAYSVNHSDKCVVTIKIIDEDIGTDTCRKWHLEFDLVDLSCLLKYGKNELLKSTNFDDIAKALHDHNTRLKREYINRKVEHADKSGDVGAIITEKIRIKMVELSLKPDINQYDKSIQTYFECYGTGTVCINIRIISGILTIEVKSRGFSKVMTMDLADPHFDPDKIGDILPDIINKVTIFNDKFIKEFEALDLLETFRRKQ